MLEESCLRRLALSALMDLAADHFTGSPTSFVVHSCGFPLKRGQSKRFAPAGIGVKKGTKYARISAG